MNVIIYDFKAQKYDVGVPVEKVSEIGVSVISGDEILAVRTDDGDLKVFDADTFSDSRREMSFFNGAYVVLKDQLEEWTNRKDSYDWVLSGEHEIYGSF